MKILEGKSKNERNKIIAAIILGSLALISLIYVFGPSIFGSKTSVSTDTSASRTPSPTPSPRDATPVRPDVVTESEAMQDYQSTPVLYNPHAFRAPEAGRNIFAFYEPPPPTPVPVGPVNTPLPTPKPTPTPPLVISFISPQNVFAGEKGFRLEVSGDKFTPETKIHFNGGELPTNFISPQKITADIPQNFIASEGPRQIEVRSQNGRLYALPVMLNVQAPPRPQLTYIGMIARRSYNNDTAYLQETGKPAPSGVRLNDVVQARFRVVSISSAEIVLEDTSLGFKHRIPMYRPDPGQTADTKSRGGSPSPVDGGFVQQYPGFPPQNYPPPSGYPQNIPGIPANMRPYNPNQPPPNRPPEKKQDQNDDEDDDGNNE
jgi:hypothetical protein